VLSNELYDSYSAFATKVYTPTQPGLYRFNGSLAGAIADDAASLDYVVVGISKNGAQWPSTNFVVLGGTRDGALAATNINTWAGGTTFYADGIDDYFDLSVYIADASGDTLSITQAWFSAEFLGATVNMQSSVVRADDFLEFFCGFPRIALTTNMMVANATTAADIAPAADWYKIVDTVHSTYAGDSIGAGKHVSFYWDLGVNYTGFFRMLHAHTDNEKVERQMFFTYGDAPPDTLNLNVEKAWIFATFNDSGEQILTNDVIVPFSGRYIGYNMENTSGTTFSGYRLLEFTAWGITNGFSQF